MSLVSIRLQFLFLALPRVGINGLTGLTLTFDSSI